MVQAPLPPAVAPVSVFESKEWYDQLMGTEDSLSSEEFFISELASYNSCATDDAIDSIYVV